MPNPSEGSHTMTGGELQSLAVMVEGDGCMELISGPEIARISEETGLNVTWVMAGYCRSPILIPGDRCPEGAGEPVQSSIRPILRKDTPVAIFGFEAPEGGKFQLAKGEHLIKLMESCGNFPKKVEALGIAIEGKSPGEPVVIHASLEEGEVTFYMEGGIAEFVTRLGERYTLFPDHEVIVNGEEGLKDAYAFGDTPLAPNVVAKLDQLKAPNCTTIGSSPEGSILFSLIAISIAASSIHQKITERLGDVVELTSQLTNFIMQYFARLIELVKRTGQQKSLPPTEVLPQLETDIGSARPKKSSPPRRSSSTSERPRKSSPPRKAAPRRAHTKPNRRRGR